MRRVAEARGLGDFVEFGLAAGDGREDGSIVARVTDTFFLFDDVFNLEMDTSSAWIAAGSAAKCKTAIPRQIITAPTPGICTLLPLRSLPSGGERPEGTRKPERGPHNLQPAFSFCAAAFTWLSYAGW